MGNKLQENKPIPPPFSCRGPALGVLRLLVSAQGPIEKVRLFHLNLAALRNRSWFATSISPGPSLCPSSHLCTPGCPMPSRPHQKSASPPPVAAHAAGAGLKAAARELLCPSDSPTRHGSPMEEATVRRERHTHEVLSLPGCCVTLGVITPPL